MCRKKEKRKFNWKVFAAVVGCILVVYLVIAVLPRPQSRQTNDFVIKQGSQPLLIAHGGGNREFPDNTLEACYNAYSVNPEVMLEMDVSITKDGVIIMSPRHHFGLPHQRPWSNSRLELHRFGSATCGLFLPQPQGKR